MKSDTVDMEWRNSNKKFFLFQGSPHQIEIKKV